MCDVAEDDVGELPDKLAAVRDKREGEGIFADSDEEEVGISAESFCMGLSS
jgi:hypothetical protein